MAGIPRCPTCGERFELASLTHDLRQHWCRKAGVWWWNALGVTCEGIAAPNDRGYLVCGQIKIRYEDLRRHETIK